MDGPRFVAFLQQTPKRTQRPKLESVADFVDAAMVALGNVFDGIEKDEERNQAYAGVAYQISVLSREGCYLRRRIYRHVAISERMSWSNFSTLGRSDQHEAQTRSS